MGTEFVIVHTKFLRTFSYFFSCRILIYYFIKHRNPVKIGVLFAIQCFNIHL